MLDIISRIQLDNVAPRVILILRMIKDIPLLVAHRGYPSRYPENTLEGIAAALQSGACFVEFDVQLSADGVPVVIHDQNLQRTAGVDLSVLETSFSGLKNICVGEATQFNDRYNNAKLPALDDIVKLFGDWPRAQAVVEIKRSSLRRFGREAVLKPVSTALQSLRDNAIVISFDHDVMFEFRRLDLYRTGWIIDNYTDQICARAEALKPDYLIVKDELIPAATASLWQGPWLWMVYTVDEPQHALELARLGASLVETNAIGEMLRHPLLAQKACNND